MALEIQQSNTTDDAPWTTWFLYGDMGSGKTRACASFPRPLFLVPANEGSQLTLRQLKDKSLDFIVIGKTAAGAVVPVRQHFGQVLTELEGLYKQSMVLLAKGDPESEKRAEMLFPWQTIVVESLTHLGDLIVEDVSDYGRKKMDQQQWGLISTFLRTVHSRLRGMDVHVVYTALAKVQTNDSGGIVAGGPNVIGSMAEKLPSACDVVVYLEELHAPRAQDGTSQSVYRAFFRKYRHWQARTRFGGFPEHMDSFDWSKLSKLLG